VIGSCATIPCRRKKNIYLFPYAVLTYKFFKRLRAKRIL
jgi:hypothetical protein